MAHTGGGAEAHARHKQYAYGSNASLVLTSDTRPHDTHEPTGEPETLWGKIDPKHFGDRVHKGRPQELEEKLQKSKRNKELDPDAAAASDSKRGIKRRRLAEESVLNLPEEGVYQPKTRETRAAYEALLSVIQQHLGGQPQDVLCGAADEVLAVLKNDKIKAPDKKVEIEKLLNRIPNQTFDVLVQDGKKITDFQDGGADEAGAGNGNTDGDLDDGIGVAVEFDEDEDSEESDLDQVQDEDEEEDDATDVNGARSMQMGGGVDDEDMSEANGGVALNAQDIDAYWLQRKISHAFEEIDQQHCQKLAEEVLQILAEVDDREVERRLVVLLDFEKFSLIKFLLQNRLKIVWCTRLARAEDQVERKKIEEEMMGLGPDLAVILEQLHATRATAKERQKNLEKSIREEARRLKDESGGRDGERGREEG